MDQSIDPQPNVTRREVVRKGALAAGGLALGTATFSGSAAAHPPQRFDVAGQTIFNPCTGEGMMVTEGTAQLHVHIRSDAAGGLHVNAHVNLQGVKAVGMDSGRDYQLTGAGSGNFNAKLPFPATGTVVLNATVTSRGAAENWRLKLRAHLTVNANGEVTVLRFEASQDCQG